MSALLNAIDSFIADIQGEQAWVEEFNAHSKNLAKQYSTATPLEVSEALRRLASLFPNVPLVALGQIAITCGSLVENGGDPEIAGPALLERLARVNETATDFYIRCRTLAEADSGLIEESRAEAAENVDADDLTVAEIINERIVNHGWQDLAQRFGPVLFNEYSSSVLGYMAEEFFRLGLIAHLSRSKSLRKMARANSEFLEQTLKADHAADSHRSFLGIMLKVLDDEPILVVHLEQRKGFEIRISGIADNFQLHTLLAGSLIDSSDQGMVKGEALSKRAVAECRDTNLGLDGGDNVTGAFNLWNWTGLRPDGQLAKEQQDSEHWIWNEGCPMDIVPFKGRRVVLLGPPPYVRHWRAGRLFRGMIGELTIERRLSEAEVEDWLNQFRRTIV